MSRVGEPSLSRVNGRGRACSSEPAARSIGGVAEFDGFVKLRPEGERYFACGERTAGLEKTGTRQVFWNVDPPAGHTASFNNLYTSIPFVLCLHEGRAHGVFYDHPGRIELDLAKTDPERVVVEAHESLQVSVILGPTPADVLERYTALTGRTPMPPLWALGNQQSRWSYMSAEEVRSVAAEFRCARDPLRRALPRHRLHGRLPRLHVGRRALPGSGGADRGAACRRGSASSTITDPGVKVDPAYHVYACRSGAPGSSAWRPTAPSTATWCGRGCVRSPTSSNPAVREWWGSLHDVLVDAGVAGVWCDMNEPAMFVPAQSTMPGDVRASRAAARRGCTRTSTTPTGR